MTTPSADAAVRFSHRVCDMSTPSTGLSDRRRAGSRRQRSGIPQSSRRPFQIEPCTGTKGSPHRRALSPAFGEQQAPPMSATRAFMIVRSGAGVVLFGAERCGDVGSNPGDMLGPAARGRGHCRGLPCAPHVSVAPRSLDCANSDDIESALEVGAFDGALAEALQAQGLRTDGGARASDRALASLV